MKRELRTILSEVRRTVLAIDEDGARALMFKILSAPRIFLAGRGRTGSMVAAFAQRLTQIGLSVHYVGEPSCPRVQEEELLLACSGSGETPTIIAMAQAARDEGATVAVITAHPRSPAAKKAHMIITIPAEKGKKSEQPARSLFEQSLLLFLDALVLMIAREIRISPEEFMRRHTNLE
ncbi:MAG: 6-phospho-3-hexuloisomerase [Candidatus Eisenbacteria bacterium]